MIMIMGENDNNNNNNNNNNHNHNHKHKHKHKIKKYCPIIKNKKIHLETWDNVQVIHFQKKLKENRNILFA